MTTLAASFTASPQLWYLTRATAIVAFVLLTVDFGLGLASTQRLRESRYWPRFATQQLHRNVALLALGFTVMHILTTVIDTFVQVGWWAVAVPFTSTYDSLGVAMGTFAFDAILLVIGTSLVRERISLRAWRAIHWIVYAMWPLAFGHFLITGTDAAHGRWGLYLALASLGVLVAATAARWSTSARRHSLTVMPRVAGLR
ncbi:MAG TPA: ferric reductase-like transmembrane domain-containing protein [Mycobacteriales bacterium]|nr:ferric reductase-like transmembrane domain-containing protein [Mycobacteriales bacterium]